MDDLDRLPTRVRAQILRKIERLEDGLFGNIKRLHEAEATYRLRMGDYRILF
jgi:mRNA-degrading endonuclease RelE of RelBE toxin-antitoxin system